MDEADGNGWHLLPSFKNFAYKAAECSGSAGCSDYLAADNSDYLAVDNSDYLAADNSDYLAVDNSDCSAAAESSASSLHSEAPAASLLFSLTVDQALQPVKECQLVRDFDTGNGHTLVSQLPDGGYQYVIRDVFGHSCCLLVCDARFSECRCALKGNDRMRTFGLNNALMLLTAFAGSYHRMVLMHASCVRYGQYAYPFIAESGTGKSTHTSLWLKHIEGAELLNDDNPIVRILDDGTPMLYGSPWSGKTPCYRNIKAPLGAVVSIERAPANRIEKNGAIEAFASLLPACSSMMWDEHIYPQMCDVISHIIETTPVYTLYCLPDEEAARLSFSTITSLQR